MLLWFKKNWNFTLLGNDEKKIPDEHLVFDLFYLCAILMMIVMGWELGVLLLLICLFETNSNTTIFPCVNICFSLLISMRNGHCFGIFMQIGSINLTISVVDWIVKCNFRRMVPQNCICCILINYLLIYFCFINWF